MPGSVHSMNHIVFRRSSDAEGREMNTEWAASPAASSSCSCPPIWKTSAPPASGRTSTWDGTSPPSLTRWYRTSSTATASISGSPSTSGCLQAGDLEFSHISQPDRHLWEELTEVPLQGREQPPEIDPRDGLCILRDAGSRPRVLGFLTLRTVNSGGLYEALGDTELGLCPEHHGGAGSAAHRTLHRPTAAAAMMWASC